MLHAFCRSGIRSRRSALRECTSTRLKCATARWCSATAGHVSAGAFRRYPGEVAVSDGEAHGAARMMRLKVRHLTILPRPIEGIKAMLS
jgi:hypothetical protein